MEKNIKSGKSGVNSVGWINGEVVLPSNWVNDKKNRVNFSAEKLQNQDQTIAKSISQTLNIEGQNAMQSNLRMGNNKIIDVAMGVDLSDGLSLANGVADMVFDCIDSGSDLGNLVIKLKFKNYNLNFTNGLPSFFKFRFIAPFTANPLAKFEEIEFVDLGIKYPVSRANFDVNLDKRPSFIKDKIYTMVFNGAKFEVDDKNLQGFIMPFGSNDYTPAGYLDLAYNYNGYPNLGFYRYLASYNPDDTKGFTFLSQKKAMLPEHGHDYNSGNNSGEKTANNGNTGALNNYGPFTTSGVKRINGDKVVLGDDLYPSTTNIRYLMKI
jgi:hypothetical protein